MLTVQSIFLTRDGYHIPLYTIDTYISACIKTRKVLHASVYIPQDGKFLENLVSPCETTNPLFTRQKDGNVSRRWKSDF